MQYWWRRVLWLTLVLVLLLGNTAHARRTGLRRSSRRRTSQQTTERTEQATEQRATEQQQQQQTRPQTRSQTRQQTQQQERDPWLPEQVVQQTRGRVPENVWIPEGVLMQHTHHTPDNTHLWVPTQQQEQSQQVPQNAWFPERVDHPQQEVIWQQQTPMPRGSCSVPYDEVPTDHIHSFLVNVENKELIYPDIVGLVRVLEVTPDTVIVAACPGDGNTLTHFQRPYITIRCTRGRLLYRKKPVTWSGLGCMEKPEPTLRGGRRRCGRGGRTRIIGWRIRKGVFLPQVTLCFDPRQETTLFESHLIHGRYIDAKVVEPSRPSFKAHDMFSITMRNSYPKRTQKSLLAGLLNTTDHLTARGQHYLAKGHLAPDSDFVLEAEQDATYYYVNVVPQWQAINNGNWKILEYEVRDLAERRWWPIKVWTGTHGTLELPDNHNNPIKLFLGLSFCREVVPVPALLWKVIHDPITHTAVGIVMVNDVRGRGTSDSWGLGTPPCPDVCGGLPWVKWDTGDTSRGRTYCCTVDALRKTIASVPNLGTVSLLKY